MKIDGLDVDVLIFDLFGVLISFDNDIVYSRLARHCADPDAAFIGLNGLMSGRDVITGAVTLRQIHRRLIEQLGFTLDFTAFEAAWLEPYSQAMPGMADMIQSLSQRYRLALLSNVDRYYWQVVRTMHPELRAFESLLLSCDLGLAKPDSEIFLHACRAMRTPPSSCYFVDDTLANVDAARAVGLHTHWFRTVAGLCDALQEARASGL